MYKHKYFYAVIEREDHTKRLPFKICSFLSLSDLHVTAESAEVQSVNRRNPATSTVQTFWMIL